MDVEKPNVKPQALPLKKRVAHEAKHTEVHTHEMTNLKSPYSYMGRHQI